MRPRSIVQFEQVYLAQMLVGIVAAYLTADANAALLQSGGLPVTPAKLIFGQWALSAIFVAFALLASRKGSNVSRWVVVVLSAFAIAGFLVSVRMLPSMGMVAILAVAQCVLAVVVIRLLFRPDAKAWFAGRRA